MIQKILTALFISVSISLTAQKEVPSDSFEFTLVDVVPVARGCDKNMSNEALKKCFTKNVTEITAGNIDMKFIENQNLNVGKYRINILFTINKKGKIVNISTDSENQKIDEHFIKAIKHVKKMKPAILNGKAVGVCYNLPIIFKVE